MSKKAPPPGILNFWGPKEPAKTEPTAPARPGKRPEARPVVFPGQLYKLILDAPDVAHAKGALGALLTAVLTGLTARGVFAKQSLFLNRPLGPVTELRLGELTLYAKAGSSDPKLAGAMAVDRIAFALTECRADKQIDDMINTVGLRVTTNT